MDITQIQEFFYWTASIAMILLGIFVIGLIALLVYIKKLADRGLSRLDQSLSHVSDMTRTWRNLAFTRFLVKILRLII